MGKIKKQAFIDEIAKFETKAFESFVQEVMSIGTNVECRKKDGPDGGFDFLLIEEKIIGGCYCPSKLDGTKLNKICADIMKFLCIYFCEKKFKFTTIYEVIKADYTNNKDNDTLLLTQSDCKTLDIEKVMNYYELVKKDKSLNTRQVQTFYKHYLENKKEILKVSFSVEFIYREHLYTYLNNKIETEKIGFEKLREIFSSNNISYEAILNRPNENEDFRALFESDIPSTSRVREWVESGGENDMQLFLEQNYMNKDKIRQNTNLFLLNRLQEHCSDVFLGHKEMVINEIDYINDCYLDKYSSTKERFDICSTNPLCLKMDREINDDLKEAYSCQLGYENELTRILSNRIEWGKKIE